MAERKEGMFMKKRLLLVWVAAMSIFITGCCSGVSSQNPSPGPNQSATEKENDLPSGEKAGGDVPNSNSKEGISDGSDTENVTQNAGESSETETGMPGAGTKETVSGNDISGSNAVVGNFDIKSLKNLNAGTDLIADTYYKAGDIRKSLAFSLNPEGFESNRLNCGFCVQDNVNESFGNEIASAVLETENGKTSYTITPKLLDSEQENIVCQITFSMDDAVPHISVSGDTRLEGDYYSSKHSFRYPDIFCRRLGKADLYLLPTEDLWLLRNEIYAAHGRKFDSEILNQYFSVQPWYRAVTDAKDFSESMLSEIEKKNIALIHEVEEEPFDERNTIDGIDYATEWDRLPTAPYLSYLNRSRETGLSANLTKAKDMGVYYSAPGSISIPASITTEQLSVVQSGGEIDVVINELTGQSQVLVLDPNADDDTYYGYLMYDKGSTPMEYGCETGIIPDLETGTYTLWQTSADTVMKTVYEGDIYILKGAVTGADTSLGEASKNQTEIKFAGAGSVNGNGNLDTPAPDVTGNHLSYNEKGYFTAIYYLGD